mgnify:CR=1 FL=1
MIYLIGSLRNPKIPLIANQLRKSLKEEIFDDWYSPGSNTDEEWQKYESLRGRKFKEALEGFHAREVFEFDQKHLDRANAAVLILPCGKSGHMELGYIIGNEKPGYILLPGEPERFDVMYGFATEICTSIKELIKCLKRK